MLILTMFINGHFIVYFTIPIQMAVMLTGLVFCLILFTKILPALLVNKICLLVGKLLSYVCYSLSFHHEEGQSIINGNFNPWSLFSIVPFLLYDECTKICPCLDDFPQMEKTGALISQKLSILYGRYAINARSKSNKILICKMWRKCTLNKGKDNNIWHKDNNIWHKSSNVGIYFVFS